MQFGDNTEFWHPAHPVPDHLTRYEYVGCIKVKSDLILVITLNSQEGHECGSGQVPGLTII